MQPVLGFLKRLKLIHYGVVGVTVLVIVAMSATMRNPAVAPTTISVAPTVTGLPKLNLSDTPVSGTSGKLSPVVLGAMCHPRYVNKADPEAVLPDANCTPGATNPAVTQATIQQTICVPGYTKTIRPSVTYTNHLKLKSIGDYGYTNTNPRSYEEDHLISLELGGSPTSPLNLWAEPGASINEKDKVENYLHQQVCSGVLSLQEAQREIVTNWYQVFLSLPH